MTCGSKRTPRRLAETEPSGRGAEAGGPAPREPHPGGNLSETGAKDGPRDTAGPAGCLCCDGTNCYMCCSTLGQVVVWGHLLTLGSPWGHLIYSCSSALWGEVCTLAAILRLNHSPDVVRKWRVRRPAWNCTVQLRLY